MSNHNFQILCLNLYGGIQFKVSSRSYLEGRLEGQDGLAGEGEHQGVGDLQDDLQDDLQGDLLQVGAVRATPKGSLQHK